MSAEYVEHRSDAFDSGKTWKNDFREYIPPAGHPRIHGLDKVTVHSYSRDVLSRPRPQSLFAPWYQNWEKPFIGITCDNTKIRDLYSVKEEGAPTSEMVAAAETLLSSFSPDELFKCCFDIDSVEWRKWANPEIMFNDIGIRLEAMDPRKRDLVLDLLRSSLSPNGFEKALGAMRTNQFLGELVNARPILNEYSYHFLLFGQPSVATPWGFLLFGHHLCLSVFVLGKQMVISPMFVGAEPNVIDSGPYKGTALFLPESELALKLMQSLPPDLQAVAQIYKKMHDPAMPEGRWHPADQRQLSGAAQDNRVIPYEGVLAISMPSAQQDYLRSIIATYMGILPSGPFNARMAQIQSHWPETYFSWIGAFGEEDPFYYRIQSPVVLIEFDHHAGVFLLNAEPSTCHVHTIIRMPNGGDYGRELLGAWRSQKYY
ncbi:hypothetical protein EDD36DRAFT_498790 [Exophiala viscosa]|uniref:DUF3500 domain-containing protein n=1 Tax=Exophiala viscosa TaxID=2486360 RepID=A0AAN6DRI2_9EURO|nr:hypothetical protein EDD36DRAFT_498790 [Exophiala viscosa]